LRRSYDDIRARGAELIAIGTGNIDYARHFMAEEDIPFPVLVDDDGAAARAAALPRVGIRIMTPKTWQATRETRKRGFHTKKPGKRVDQLGATFVIGPGDVVHYEHVDANSADHASIDEVLTALP
jgi:peroxiredoxin